MEQLLEQSKARELCSAPVQVTVQDTSVAGACLSLALGSQLLGLGLHEESRAWHL